MEVQNLNGRFKVIRRGIPSAGDCMGKGALKLHRTLQGMPAETGLEEIDHLLRKLVERKILKNENGAVTALVKKETVQRYESQAVVEKWFDHSLPGFVAAFLGEKKLSRKEAEELKQLIDTYQEDGEDMR